MNTIRIGIIGIGAVARNRHIPRLKRIPGVELRLAWSRNPDNAHKAAAEFGVHKTVGHWRQVVESPNVDAVIIATPPVLHMPATLAALEAGKHVLCQARMARNLKEAQRMLDAARASNLVTALYPPLPGLTGDRVVQRLLHEESYVGAIREVRVAGLAFGAKEAEYNWRYDPEVVGVNAMTLGMWVEILNRWVGPASSVVARGRTHTRQYKNLEGAWTQAVVPDSLAIAADLECGATATYHFSSHATFAPYQAIEIYGSRGALVYDLSADEMCGATEGSEGLEAIHVPPNEVRDQSTDAEFVQAIREGTSVSPDFEEGVRYVEFCEAVAQSLATDAAVCMPPEPKMDSWGIFLE